VRELLKRRVPGALTPLTKAHGPTASPEQRRVLALVSLMNEKTRVEKRLVRAFRLWQKELLNRYLELLNDRMREAKKSVIVRRLKIIVSKMSERLRRTLLKWRRHARKETILLQKHTQIAVLRASDPQRAIHIGILRLLNTSVGFKSQAIGINSVTGSTRTAFF